MQQRTTSATLEPYLATRDISVLWSQLHSDLEPFGFDRVFYGCSQRRPANGELTKRDAVIKSSYGSDFDDYFVDNRAFLADVTTQWAIDSQGAMSWGLTRRLMSRGQLTAAQRDVHERTRALGILSGYTVSLRKPGTSLVSGFGLCAEAKVSQQKVDLVWQDHGDKIVSSLTAFDTCARALPRCPADEELSARQREVLEWAGEGKTIEDISEILGIHRSTVVKHMYEARDRLGVGNTLQAVVRATIQGQIFK